MDSAVQQVLHTTLLQDYGSGVLGKVWREGVYFFQYTVGPLIIESFWVKNRVSTGALGALDAQLVVQTKI